jgi:hypothetical protein
MNTENNKVDKSYQLCCVNRLIVIDLTFLMIKKVYKNENCLLKVLILVFGENA